MQLTLVTKDVQLDDSIQDDLKQRVEFAMKRFAPRIKDVLISLKDVNGPRGGVDKFCRLIVQLHLRHEEEIVVETTSDNCRAAVAQAAHRCARAVQRVLERRRKHLNGKYRRSMLKFV